MPLISRSSLPSRGKGIWSSLSRAIVCFVESCNFTGERNKWKKFDACWWWFDGLTTSLFPLIWYTRLSLKKQQKGSEQRCLANSEAEILLLDDMTHLFLITFWAVIKKTTNSERFHHFHLLIQLIIQDEYNMHNNQDKEIYKPLFSGYFTSQFCLKRRVAMVDLHIKELLIL